MSIDQQKLYDYVGRLASLVEIVDMSSNQLQTLKENLRSTINSKRKFEEIETIQDLFACLKSRGILKNINQINAAFSDFVTTEHKIALFEEFKDVAYVQVKRKNFYRTARKNQAQQNSELNELRWEEIGILLDDMIQGRGRREFVRYLSTFVDGLSDENIPTKEALTQIVKSNHKLLSDSELFEELRKAMEAAECKENSSKLKIIENWCHDK